MRLKFIGLAVLVLAACNLTTSPAQPTTTAVPEAVSVTVSATLTPVPVSNLTQTHTDSELGISFDYPAGWIVDATLPGSLIQLYSPSALTPQPGKSEGIPDGSTKIEIIKIPSASPYSTIDGFIEFSQKNSDGPSGKVEVLNRLTLAGEIPAARLQFTSPMAGNVSVLVFEVNGMLVTANGYGDVSRFNEITATLRRAGA